MASVATRENWRSRGCATAGPLIAVLLALYLGMGVVRSESVLRLPQTGTLRDAERITAFLKESLREGDNVIAIVPSSYPLAYHFVRDGVSTSYLLAGAKRSCRFLIVVDAATRVTLANALDSARIRIRQTGGATVLRRFGSASLVQLKGPAAGDSSPGAPTNGARGCPAPRIKDDRARSDRPSGARTIVSLSRAHDE